MSRACHNLLQQLSTMGISCESTLNALSSVPREQFLPPVLRHKAWENTALPIGDGQTLSQPYIVARMTQLAWAHCTKHEIQQPKILEIGTGSGYQTAVLGQLFTQVYSIERIKSLQFQARRRLQQIGLYDIQLKHSDGWQGWPSQAPFDVIIVTAAAERLPPALLAQLSNCGCLIIPLGEHEQLLYQYFAPQLKRQPETIEDVNFVPLVAGDLR